MRRVKLDFTFCFLHFALVSALMMAGGCLVSAPPQPKSWVVSAPRKPTADLSVAKVARLGSLSVAAPYDKPALAVRRKDGSIAFDAYNVFATTPSSLLRAPLATLLEGGGTFGRILPSSSTARTGTTVEAVVNDLFLDCREEDRRIARVSLSLAVVENREVKDFLDGEGEADVADGDYSAAFSAAFEKAISSALATLPSP